MYIKIFQFMYKILILEEFKIFKIASKMAAKGKNIEFPVLVLFAVDE